MPLGPTQSTDSSKVSQVKPRPVDSPFVTVPPKGDEAEKSASSGSNPQATSSIPSSASTGTPLTAGDFRSSPGSPSSSSPPLSSLTGPVSMQTTPPPVAPTEVALRAAVRRTLAEQQPRHGFFHALRPIDALKWKLMAFLTGQSFDEYVFRKTNRFRVEEVYLLRKKSLTLVSYASRDPIRHAYPRKVDFDLRRLRREVQTALEAKEDFFSLPSHRQAVIRTYRRTYLVAITRGPENLLLRTDLDYTHCHIEHLIGKRIEDEVSNFTFPLQPLLEECLLIQSPGSPS